MDWWILIPIGIALLGIMSHGVFMAIAIFLVGYAGGAFFWDHSIGMVLGFILLAYSLVGDAGGNYKSSTSTKDHTPVNKNNDSSTTKTGMTPPPVRLPESPTRPMTGDTYSKALAYAKRHKKH